MKKLLMLSVVIILAGCAGIAKTETKQTITEGDKVTVTETRSYARQPRNPLEGASVTISNTYSNAKTSGAQDKATIDREKWIGLGRIALYALCTLVTLLGGLIMFYGEKLGMTRAECNRDGMIIMGCGIGSIALFQFVEASAPIMKWVIPVVFVGVIVYFGFTMWKKKK